MATQPTLTLTNDPGGLFNRLGAIFKIIEENRTWQVTTAATRQNNVLDQYYDPGEPLNDLEMIPDFLAKMTRARSRRDALNAQLLEEAKRAVRLQMEAIQDLPSSSDRSVVERLIFQMETQSASIAEPTITPDGPTLIPGSPTGDGTIIVSGKNEANETSAYLRNEDILLILTSLAGEGTYQIQGKPVVSPRSSYLWPGGSGSGTQFPIVDPDVDGSGTPGIGKQVLKNGNFESFVASTPTAWQALAGSAGTHFDAETSDVYNGSSALKLIGQNARVMLEQRLYNATSGTPATLAASSQYLCAFRCKASHATLGGDITMDVEVDGSSIGSVTISDTTAPTSWTLKTFFAFSPSIIPSAAAADFTVKLGNPSGEQIDSGKSILIDDVVIAKMVPHGGLWYAGVRGQTSFSEGDDWFYQIANNSEASAKFHFYLDMMYDLMSMGLVIPYSGSPTIADALIA